MKTIIIKTVAICALVFFSSTLFSQNNSKVKDIGEKSLSGITSINELVDINRYILVDDYEMTLVHYKTSEQKEVEMVYIITNEFASFEDNINYIIEKANEGDLLYVEDIRCTFKDKCWWENSVKMTLEK